MRDLSWSFRGSTPYHRTDPILLMPGQMVLSWVLGTALILKRLEDALKDNDRIYALISGFSRERWTGRHIAAPDEKGQCRVIKNLSRWLDIMPILWRYIEAHGTGTPVGDVARWGL